jgi:hypothetical protein
MTHEEPTVAEFATKAASNFTPIDKLFLTGRMLVKETFKDALMPDENTKEVNAQFAAPELRFAGRLMFKAAAEFLKLKNGEEDTFARRILSINQASIDGSISICRYDSSGLVVD